MGDRARALTATVAVFLATLFLYLRTLHAGVAGGDAGELTAVACRLGIAHPPGYPLYTLLAHLFTHLPAGSPAWRVAAFSATCDAAAAAILFAIVRGITGSAVAGGLAAAMAAFSPLIWEYATQAEVFALNNLFVALLLYLAMRWNRSRSDTTAILIAFVAGAGLTNHHTLLLTALPLLAWMIAVSHGRILRPRSAAAMTAAGVAGLLPYAYLPAAASWADTTAWGDPSSVGGFLDILLRRDYGTFRLGGEAAVTLATFAMHVRAFTVSLATNVLFVGLVPLAVGAALGLRTKSADRPFHVLLAAAVACNVAVFAALANLPLEDPLLLAVTSRFWQQPQLVLMVWLGCGAAWLGARLPRTVAAGAAVAIAAAQLGANFAARDQSTNRFVEDYGRAILAPLPRDAVLLLYGDLIGNTVRYAQACENARPDVVVLDQEMMTKPWYVARAARRHRGVSFPGHVYALEGPGAFDMAAFADANAALRPLYVHPGIKQGDRGWRARYETVPAGIAARLLPRAEAGETQIAAAASRASAAAILEVPRPPEARYGPGTWEHVVLTDLRNAAHARGVWLLDRATAHGQRAELFEYARTALVEARSLWSGEPPWYLSKNLGLAASHLASRDTAARADAVAAWQSYLRHAPASEKDRAAVEQAVGDLQRTAD